LKQAIHDELAGGFAQASRAIRSSLPVLGRRDGTLGWLSYFLYHIYYHI